MLKEKTKKIIFQVIIVSMSLLALISVLSISYETFTTDISCPRLGIVPACYIVSVGYFLILLSAIFNKIIVFYTGWFPVFLLALSGSIMEFSMGDICPKSSDGLPMCYFSLIFTLIILWLFSKQKN